MTIRAYRCVQCGKKLSAERPVFLVLNDADEIRGPMHADCAKRVYLEGIEHWHVLRSPNAVVGRVVPSVQLPLPGLPQAPEQDL